MSSGVEFPTQFQVEVDGEQFDVRVSPVWADGDAALQTDSGQSNRKGAASKEIPLGAMVSGMAGLVISIDVQVGDEVNEGDQVAVIEAMKMMRNYLAPHGGVVKEICVQVNEMVDTEDILMVVT